MANGNNSLTAAAVLIGGPNGPRYYPEALSPASAEVFAESSRADGVPAVVVQVTLRVPDPGELLKMPRPQLWCVAKTDPFDVIEADVLEQRDREAAGEESAEVAGNVNNFLQKPAVDESIEPTAEADDAAKVDANLSPIGDIKPTADDTAERLDRIHDTIGRLALLEYSSEQASDDEQRLRIFREMHSLAVPLVKHLYPLTEDTDEDNVFTRLADEMHQRGQAEGQDEEPEDEPSAPEEGDGIVRAVAARFLDEEAGTGRWHSKLVDPTWDIGPDVSQWATEGRSVRLYDVELDLDRGSVTVRPQPGWKSESDEGTAECGEESADAPAGDDDDDADGPGAETGDGLPPEWIRDKVGRLATLTYTIEQAGDDEHRAEIVREMHRTAASLAILLEEDCGCGQLLCIPEDDPDCPFQRLVDEFRARSAEAAMVAPIKADAADNAEPLAEELAPEQFGDESTYFGTAEFERLRGRWTVWTLEPHPAARPELQASFRKFKKALREAESFKAAPGCEFAAVILGPGHGGVRVDNITLWPREWVTRTITDEEVYPPADAILELNGDPVTRELAVMHAKRIAATDSYGTPACPIVFLPYRPATEGGAR